MRNPLESIIQNHLQDPTTSIPTEKRCGLVLRYSNLLWKKGGLDSFRISYTCNALLISIMENHSPKEITKNPRGIEANFINREEALEAAFALQKFLIAKDIPASIVLYVDEGILHENGQWFSSEFYKAEKIALYSMAHEIRLMSYFQSGFTAPDGIGIFRIKSTQSILFEEELCTAKDYR